MDTNLQDMDVNTATPDTIAHLRAELKHLKTQNDSVTQIGNELITVQTKLVSLLHNASDGIITINSDGTVETFNITAQQIFGYSEGDVITRQIAHLIPCPDWAENNVAVYIRHFLLSRDSDDFPLVGLHKDGHDILLHVTSAEVSEAEIELFDTDTDTDTDKCEDEALVCFVRDITINKKLDKELKEHKEAFDNASGIIVRDPECKMTYINTLMLNSLGLSEEEINENESLLTPIFRDNIDFYEVVRQTNINGSWRGEVVYKHRDGHVKWFDSSTTVFQDSDGNPSQYHSILFDITARKEAEKKLQDERQFFSGITDAMAEGMYVQDSKGICTYINPEGAKLLGWSVNELIGKDMHKVIHYQRIDGVPILDEKCLLTQSIETKGAFHTDSEVFWRKDGSRIHVYVSVVPTYDNSTLKGAVVAFQDITQRKKDEQTLLELKTSLDTTSIVAVTDAKGTITYVNEKFCQISQYSRNELIGKNHSMLNSGTHPKTLWTEMYQTAAKGKPWYYQICNRAKDGSLYWVDSTIIGYKDERGKLSRYVAIRTDITKQKELEVELLKSRDNLQIQIDEQTKELRIAKEIAEEAQIEAETANHAKSDFLANMSHELRTPMHSILSFSKFGTKQINKVPLEQKAVDKVERFLSIITESGQRLMGLLNNLLDLAKLEAGKTDYEFKQQDLRITTDKILTEFTTKFEEKGIKLKILVNDSNTFAYFDHDKISQVIANLVSNAIKFTKKSSEIKIVIDKVRTSEQKQPIILWSIYDQGPGVPENELEAIFDQFIQSSKTDTGAGGTGLGLAICKEIMAAHKGQIWAENNESIGAVIRFSFFKEYHKGNQGV